jgi:hypothetical protein
MIRVGVARRVGAKFKGDVRKVWQRCSPPEAVHNLSKTLGAGPQLSRVCVLGLMEHGMLNGGGT